MVVKMIKLTLSIYQNKNMNEEVNLVIPSKFEFAISFILLIFYLDLWWDHYNYSKHDVNRDFKSLM